MEAKITEKKRVQKIIILENTCYPNVFPSRLRYLWKKGFF